MAEDRVRELSEIKTIESTSRSGISVAFIKLEDWGTKADYEQIFSKVRDRLGDATAELPPGAHAPELDQKRGAVAYSMVVSLTWHPDGPPELGILNRTAERLGDRLRNLAGSEQVVFFGAPTEEIRVDVDAAELATLGMTPQALAQQVSSADAPRSAGTLRDGRTNLALEITGALDSSTRIAAIPLVDNGAGGMVFVGDVANVRKQWSDPPEQFALHDGKRDLLIAVRTEEQVRLDRWAEAARTAIAGFGAGLDPAIGLECVFDQSRHTEARLASLGGNLLAGAIVVVLVVLVMMGWRPALIVGSSLPLSAGATLFGLTFFDEQFQTALDGRIGGRVDADAITLAPGYRIEVAGDSAERQRAIGQLLTYVPVLATLMIASLVLSFRSFALASLIGIVAVFSVGLGLLSLWVAGYPLGFNPIIGSAGLVGVAINGSIVVLAAIRANPSARRGDATAIIDEGI